MNCESKKRLLSNFSFIFLFSLLFTTCCQLAILVFNNAEVKIESTEASSEIFGNLILLDAGHGGEDGGTVGVNGVKEKTLNLEMSESLEIYLKFVGFKVVQTRKEDVMLYDKSQSFKGRKKILDLAERLRIAEELSPDLFISIHMNAFPDGRYSGLTVYYSPHHERSRFAAELIRGNVVEYLQPENRRELKSAGSNIYLLDRLHTPSVLVECGFLSNKAECELLCTQEYRQKLSLVLLSSVSSFFE